MGAGLIAGATEVVGNTSSFSLPAIPTRRVQPHAKPAPADVAKPPAPPAKLETLGPPAAPRTPAPARLAPAPPPPRAVRPAAPQPAAPQAARPEVAANATKDERLAAFHAADAAYTAARHAFNGVDAAYWNESQHLRAFRNALDSKGNFIHPLQTLTDENFVNQAPPTYHGPAKPKPHDFGLTDADVGSTAPPGPEPHSRELPTVPDFIAAAKAEDYALDFSGVLGSKPTPAEKTRADAVERAFRSRYAAASLALGLNGSQVVGVFGLETAGKGRVFEQPIDPKTHRAISTALGNAQLLAGNSVDMMMRYGDDIKHSLLAEASAARAHGRAGDAKILTAKADIVDSMYNRLTTMKREHRGDLDPDQLAKTQFGMAIHAANLDPSIGPYLQAHKLGYTLDQYKHHAAQSGLDPKVPPSAGVLEGMNLAGPVNGFLLSHPALASRLTVNFFTRAGYTGNPITQQGNHRGNPPRRAGELMSAMSTVMKTYAATPESIALARAFADLGDRSALAASK